MQISTSSVSPSLASGHLIASQSNTTNQMGASYSTSSIASASNQYHANLLMPAGNTNLMPLQISSPNSIKTKLHKKKPSQSSMISTNTNIIASSNSMQNSTNLTQSTTSQLSANSNSNNTTANNNTNANTSNTNTGTNQSADQNNTSHLQHEDIEIMKQRSANNNTFLCIKITEIQLLVTYKGGKDDKEKNLKDLTNVSFQFPLFEIHDQTLTWLDLINALKSHVKKALVSQALKHKLIKVPIQPVNKLINRNRNRNNQLLNGNPSVDNSMALSMGSGKKRSASQQHLNSLQVDEQEKLTMLKLFGTKFIEKKSSQNVNNNVTTAKEDAVNAASRKGDADQNQNGAAPKESVKKIVTKSNSTLSFDLKKRFLKFSRNNNNNS